MRPTIADAVLERLTSTPAGVTLCALDDIADPGARNFVLEIGGRHFHGFVVRRGTVVTGFVDACPHMGLPLAQKLDAYLTDDASLIECDWHGALFRPDDGVCVGGPCQGQALRSWPITVAGGLIKTAPQGPPGAI